MEAVRNFAKACWSGAAKCDADQRRHPPAQAVRRERALRAPVGEPAFTRQSRALGVGVERRARLARGITVGLALLFDGVALTRHRLRRVAA
jgi:hypothetical protein